jgi:alcohol dehydrogenase class IV
MHTPVEVTALAVDEARRLQADAIISVGGGSAVGLGKAIVLRTGLPNIAIPTTYAGSEATPILGETEGGRKTTQRTLRILPVVVVYDVDLTLTLPVSLTATSGLNAIAHAVEALYANDANPIASMLAEQAISLMAPALRSLAADPGDRTARSDALYASWACGTCLGLVGMSLHHKLCHVLGGRFGLPHAPTHAVVLPHAVAFNEAAAPDAMRRIARALGVAQASAGLFALGEAVGAPTSLAELGLRRSDLEEAADLAVANPYPNPAPLTRGGILRLLQGALDGRRPSDSATKAEATP